MLSSLPDTIHCKEAQNSVTHCPICRSIAFAYLAAGDGEVGEDAVLFILVSGVRLEAFALGVVPQLERVVERRGEDVLAVRGELDERHRRIVVVDERLEALAAGCVPDAAEPVVARRHNQRTVPIEVDRTDRIRVGRQRLQALASPHVPDPHTLVEAAGHNQIALRIEVAAEDVVAVALQRLQTLGGAQLPQLERFVVAGAHQQPAVARPGHVADAQLVSRDRLLEFAVVGSPNFYQLIGSWGHKHTDQLHQRAERRLVYKHLHELASHSPFGLNLTADTAFVWPASVNFNV